MENTMEVPQKTKNSITIWFSNPTPEHISIQNSNPKRYMHPYVHSSTIHNSQNMDTTWMSIDREMDKEDVIHVYSRILLSHKNNEIMPFAATWIELEIIELSEVNRKEKDKYHMITTYVLFKIWHKWTYLWKRNRLTDIENKLAVAKREGGGGGMEWEVSGCKLLYIERINNKVLLYSTENYIQYPVINHRGKEYQKRMYIYMCV